MRIGILSASPRAYSTKRIKEAAKARGHKVKVLNYLSFSISVAQNQPWLYVGEERLKRYDAVIPRIGASVSQFGTTVVRQFEQMGVFTLNTSHAISVARDKLCTIQILSRHGIDIPRSACLFDKESIMPTLNLLGGAPVIIKLLQGTQGVGVILAESSKSAEAIVETLQVTQQNVLMQHFVAESRGRDIRAFVIGDRVVAAMRRIAQGDEFRSNIHRGGLTEPVTLSKEYEQAAIKATQIVGLHVAGVDILEANDGPKIMEVNASPGLEGIEGATNVDIATEIIKYLEEQVAFPYFDIGERLSISRGFGIFEIPVTKSSVLAKKTLEQLDLFSQGIQILCIIRGDLAIPNPDEDETVLAGDVLLCYGEKIAVKELLPQRLKRLSKTA